MMFAVLSERNRGRLVLAAGIINKWKFPDQYILLKQAPTRSRGIGNRAARRKKSRRESANVGCRAEIKRGGIDESAGQRRELSALHTFRLLASVKHSTRFLPIDDHDGSYYGPGNLELIIARSCQHSTFRRFNRSLFA